MEGKHEEGGEDKHGDIWVHSNENEEKEGKWERTLPDVPMVSAGFYEKLCGRVLKIATLSVQ